jgi:DNA-directed RNA polymerase subunit alpha
MTLVNDYRMVLPRRVESQIAEDEYGKFIISPLERGYGTTLGVSIQKVLLSSIPGAAVVAVRVNDGLSAYAEIPGIRENMAQLILQLKQIKPKIVDSDEDQIEVRLDHSGRGAAYAKDIICPSPNISIRNSDHYLLTADDKNAHVSIDFIIRRQTGYMSAEEHQDIPDGYLPIDANFSPVERVVYEVDAARVRQKTNYDKLVLEVWTDGTITPKRALSDCSVTFIKQLMVFDPESDILANPQDYMPPEPEPEPDVNPLYDVPIEVLDLSTRVFNSLRRTGITSVGDVVDMLERGEDAMLAIRNFGQTSLDELKEKLAANEYLPEGWNQSGE